MRVSEEELRLLDAVAAHFGLDRCPTVRMLVKREHDRLEREKAARPAEKRP